ncbi:hypothetical protein ACLOJK_015131 [Asimina triloba]
MEKGGEGQRSPSSHYYSLQPCRFFNEDILFVVDVDAEANVEMKVSGAKGRPITRLDSIKQAIFLFLHSKLAINPDHRFAFAIRKEFNSNIDSALAAVRAFSADKSYGFADLTQLFRVAAHEAKKSLAQSHIFRVGHLLEHDVKKKVGKDELDFITPMTLLNEFQPSPLKE